MKGTLLILLFLIACTPTFTMQEKEQIQSELSRLAALSSEERLAVADLGQIKTLLAKDEKAIHEFEEVELMIGYGEYEHAGHTIGFVSDYIETGQNIICPGHELAHYYLFKRYQNEDMAEHSLHHGQEDFENWVTKATAYEAQYPGVESVDAIAKTIQQHFDRIASGNMTATDEEIRYLATTASICVPE
jgi:hypothetical protein